MDTKEYTKNALVTEPSGHYDQVAKRLQDHGTIRLLHASMGITTEGGEFADALKRHIFYGKEIDRINAIEEAGDLLWYIAVGLDGVGSSFEEAMQRNITKLKARFGDKFSEAAALNRDTIKERAALEG